MQERLGQGGRALPRLVPPAPHDLPRAPYAGQVDRCHQRAVGLAAIELGLDERSHLDVIDHQPRNEPAQPGIDEQRLGQLRAFKVDVAEANAGQVDVDILPARRPLPITRVHAASPPVRLAGIPGR